MNHIVNQSGETIIAGGQDGSHIRNKEQFNISFAKVFDRIELNWCQGGLSRHTEYSELEEICQADGLIFPDSIGKVIQSAYFYFDLKQKQL